MAFGKVVIGTSSRARRQLRTPSQTSETSREGIAQWLVYTGFQQRVSTFDSSCWPLEFIFLEAFNRSLFDLQCAGISSSRH